MRLALLLVASLHAQEIDVAPYVLAVDTGHRGAEIAEVHPAFDLDPEATDFGGKHLPAVWRSNGLVTGLMGILRFGPAVPAFFCWRRGEASACPPLAPLSGGARMTRMQSDAVTVRYVPFDGVEVEQTFLAEDARTFRSRARVSVARGAPVRATLHGGIVLQSETGALAPDALEPLRERPAAEAERDGVRYAWRMSGPERVAPGSEGVFEFALAMAPDSRGAARGAGAALRRSFDAALRERRKASAAFYRRVPRFEFGDAQLNLFHRVMWERLRGLAENAAGNIPYPFFMGTSAPWGIDGLWLWDAAFQAVVLQAADPVWAERLIESALAQQDESGRVPHWTTPRSRTAISQPPLLSWAAWRLYVHHGDREFLRRVYPRLARLHRWFQKERVRVDGMPFWKQPDESGMDNSPAFDEGTDAHVDLASELLADAGMLAEIAAALGEPADAEQWRAQETLWRERVGRLWSQEGRFFFPLKGEVPAKVYAVQGFFPLWDPKLEPERRRALLARLRDPSEFWTEYPVPSVSLKAEQFMQPKWFANTYGSPETGRRTADKLEDYTSVYWRGPVWVFSDAIIYEGLRRSGELETANALGGRMVRMMVRAARTGGMLWENFDPRDGRPSRLLPKGQADEMAASIYFLKALYDSRIGLEPAAPPDDRALRLRYTARPRADVGGLRFGAWRVTQRQREDGVELILESRPRASAELSVANETGAPLRLFWLNEEKRLDPGRTILLR